MRYVLALFVPWIVFFTMGKVGRGIICLILQCTIIGWLPATIWAVASTNNYYADKRTDRIVSAISTSNQRMPDPRRV
jgi:TM2 domain-containing membrane protein YozV